MQFPIYDKKGQEIEKIDLSENIFNAPENKALLAQAVRVYLTNQRQGTLSTKTRGEVAGSTRKIYRQKGTGRARHGSIRAPIFRKGGIVFGPKPRDFSLDLPKKMRKLALYQALSSKFKDNQSVIVKDVSDIKAKTKEMVAVLTNFKIDPEKDKVIFVTGKRHSDFYLAGRNVPKLELLTIEYLNALNVLNCKKIILDLDAILKLEGKTKTNENKTAAKKTVKKLKHE